MPGHTEAVEWKWAKTSNLIEKLYMVDKLGISICPGGYGYFLV
jgi:hypothetical protein